MLDAATNPDVQHALAGLDFKQGKGKLFSQPLERLDALKAGAKAVVQLPGYVSWYGLLEHLLAFLIIALSGTYALPFTEPNFAAFPIT